MMDLKQKAREWLNENSQNFVQSNCSPWDEWVERLNNLLAQCVADEREACDRMEQALRNVIAHMRNVCPDVCGGHIRLAEAAIRSRRKERE